MDESPTQSGDIPGDEILKTPETVVPRDELLENIAEASKNARSVYLIYLGYLAYCALTVFSTTDRQLVLKGETAHLPIVNVNVPLVGFFIVAPLLAIGVFIYYQLHLGKLKRLMKSLRQYYPQTKSESIYPWLPNNLDDIKEGMIARIQRWIIAFSHWYALPLVLQLFGFWVLKKHNIWLSYLDTVAIPLIGLGCVIIFWHYDVFKEPRVRLIDYLVFNSNKYGMFGFISDMSIGLAIVFAIGIPGINKGELPLFNVNLSYQKLVSEQNEDYKTLYWVDLSRVNLNGANLTGVILRHADLRKVQLYKAILDRADLFKANLSNAFMDSAHLNDANLDSADMRGVWLQGANLYNAQLQGAHLFYAQLHGAQFDYSQLQGASVSYVGLLGANLSYAQLQEAHLTFIFGDSTNFKCAVLDKAVLEHSSILHVQGLTLAQLSKVKTLYDVKLDSELLDSVKRFYPHLLEVLNDWP